MKSKKKRNKIPKIKIVSRDRKIQIKCLICGFVNETTAKEFKQKNPPFLALPSVDGKWILLEGFRCSNPECPVGSSPYSSQLPKHYLEIPTAISGLTRPILPDGKIGHRTDDGLIMTRKQGVL